MEVFATNVRLKSGGTRASALFAGNISPISSKSRINRDNDFKLLFP
jgi:hypothetical protein